MKRKSKDVKFYMVTVGASEKSHCVETYELLNSIDRQKHWIYTDPWKKWNGPCNFNPLALIIIYHGSEKK